MDGMVLCRKGWLTDDEIVCLHTYFGLVIRRGVWVLNICEKMWAIYFYKRSMNNRYPWTWPVFNWKMKVGVRLAARPPTEGMPKGKYDHTNYLSPVVLDTIRPIFCFGEQMSFVKM